MSLSAILHHGTDQTFDTPRWDMGSERRDFGRCFYTTYSRKMADDWAKYKSQEGGGITYHYVIDFTKMASCKGGQREGGVFEIHAFGVVSVG